MGQTQVRTIGWEPILHPVVRKALGFVNQDHRKCHNIDHEPDTQHSYLRVSRAKRLPSIVARGVEY